MKIDPESYGITMTIHVYDITKESVTYIDDFGNQTKFAIVTLGQKANVVMDMIEDLIRNLNPEQLIRFTTLLCRNYFDFINSDGQTFTCILPVGNSIVTMYKKINDRSFNLNDKEKDSLRKFYDKLIQDSRLFVLSGQKAIDNQLLTKKMVRTVLGFGLISVAMTIFRAWNS